MQKNSETDDEENGQRNEKTIAVRGDAGPVGIRSHEIVESERGAKNGTADARGFAPEEKDADGGEEKKRRPGKEAVIGGEKNLEKERRGPVPLGEGDVAGLNGGTVDDSFRNKSREKADQESQREDRVTSD